jgi:hypothetical protein
MHLLCGCGALFRKGTPFDRTTKLTNQQTRDF